MSLLGTHIGRVLGTRGGYIVRALTDVTAALCSRGVVDVVEVVLGLPVAKTGDGIRAG